MSYDNHRYYIFDCYNSIAGNRKGYRTFKGANQQASSHKSKLNKYLWIRADSFKVSSTETTIMVYSIKFLGVNNV